MKKRVLKSYETITLTEVTSSDGRSILNRAYSVKNENPATTRSFGDMASAETYFEQLLLERLN